MLREIRSLSPRQAAAVQRALARASGEVKSVLDAPRACPGCHGADSIRWGRAGDLQRWRCKACKRTFTAATNTPASGLRHRDAWPEFAAALLDGETLDATAERCGIHRSTAHRWRTRFLSGLAGSKQRLEGIVEVDETYRLRSFKGQPQQRRASSRKTRKRGGKATRRGLSRDQVPIVMARDRSGNTLFAVPEVFDGNAAVDILGGAISRDAVLCSDGHRAYAAAADRLGVRHESLVNQRGQRVRGPFHIQHVNGMHSQFKRWIRRFNGVSTSRLLLYVSWFGRAQRTSNNVRTPNDILNVLLRSEATEPGRAPTDSYLR